MSDQAFRSILFPVDFSEASEATPPTSEAWQSRQERPSHWSMWSRGFRDGIAKRSFVHPCQAIPACGSSRSEVVSGAVAESITEKAANWGVDLIMMPTRGLGRSRPFLIGSTTAKVLHDARCAVWTSPHLRTMKPFHGYERIVCTVDREDIPRGYIEQAARLASFFNSQLIFVTAVPSWEGGHGDERRLSDVASEFSQAEVHQLIDSVECAVISETGSVGDVTKKVAEGQNADLVLTNRGHLQHPFGKFRTHAYEIVLESPCPVLSLCIFSSHAAESNIETGALLQTSAV